MKSSPKLNPETREMMLVLAFVYLENNRPEKAAALLDAMQAMSMTDGRARCTLALSQLRSGKPKLALSTLDAMAMSGQATAVFHLVRAECLQKLDRHDEAAAAMRAYVGLRKADSRAAPLDAVPGASGV
ncbi:type III secretion apparatus assembly chaperone SctY [Achromobacter marplatensis]|uniref:type III secretion apparatus assembly chaperone SctY n=1 Tax=Achromobacter marplatensis TaxID=470868 RepID=UPI0039F6FBE3